MPCHDNIHMLQLLCLRTVRYVQKGWLGQFIKISGLLKLKAADFDTKYSYAASR